MEAEHAQILGLVPDLVDVGQALALVEPLLVGHLRLAAVDWQDIVELEGVFEGVLNILRIVFEVHGMLFIDFGHELSDLYG